MFLAISFFKILLSLLILFYSIYTIIFCFKPQNKNQFKVYALGNRKFSTIDLVATIVATWASGATFFIIIQNTYTNGLYFILARIAYPIGILLSGFVVLRMHQFFNAYSIAEAMGSIYGKKIQLIIACLGIFAKTGAIIAQFKVMATTFQLIFHIDGILASILAGCITISYTIYGGIKSVVSTDLYQFLLFSFVIIFLALKIFHDIIDPTQNIFQSLKTHPGFDLNRVIKCDGKFFTTCSLFIYYSIPGIFFPEIFHRITIAKNIYEAKSSFITASGIFLLISCILIFLGMILVYDNPNLDYHTVIPYLVNHYLAEDSMKFLLAFCILALSMSTVDSMLNTNSILFSNDIIKNLYKKKYASVQIAQFFVVFQGIVSLLIAFWINNILSTILLFESFYIAVAAVPILITFLGFRTQISVLISSMISGGVTCIIWSNFYGNLTSILPSMLISLLIFFITHYLFSFQGGWIKFSPDTPLGQFRTDKALRKQKKLMIFKHFNLFKYLLKNTPREFKFYFFFGFYLMISDYLVLYSMDYSNQNPNLGLLNFITILIISLIAMCFTCPIWASRIHFKNPKPLTYFWNITLTLTLFNSISLFILSEFQMVQFFIIIINVIIIGLSIDLVLLLVSLSLSSFFSFSIFYYYTGISISFYQLFTPPFQVVGIIIIMLAFIKEFWEYKAKSNIMKRNNFYLKKKLKKIIKTKYHNPIQRLQVMQFYNHANAIKYNTILESEDDLLIGNINNLNENLKKALNKSSINSIQINPQQISIIEFLTEVKAGLKQEDIALAIHNYMNQAKIICDKNQMIQLIIHSISFLQQVLVKNSPDLILSVKNTQIGYPKFEDKKNKEVKMSLIEAVQFDIITHDQVISSKDYYTSEIDDFAIYIPSIPTEINQKMALVNNQIIIKSHYGYYRMHYNEKYIRITYVIPINYHETVQINKKTDLY